VVRKKGLHIPRLIVPCRFNNATSKNVFWVVRVPGSGLFRTIRPYVQVIASRDGNFLDAGESRFEILREARYSKPSGEMSKIACDVHSPVCPGESSSIYMPLKLEHRNY